LSWGSGPKNPRAVEPETLVPGLVRSGEHPPDRTPVPRLAGLGRPLRQRLVQQQRPGWRLGQAGRHGNRDRDARGPVQQPQPGQLGGELLTRVGSRTELGEHGERRAVQDAARVRGTVVQAGESLAGPAAAPVRRGRALDRRQHRRVEQRMVRSHGSQY
jgi:hypothetical protein